MAISLEIKERLAKRLEEIKLASDPTQLSYAIWTKGLEEAMGSSKQEYRRCLVEWIVAYKGNRKPMYWSKYLTPEDLAEDIWPKYFDIDESDNLWFSSLRNELIKWINEYCSR